jgi:elongation factor G
VPIGVEDELKGVVDLVRWKAIYNEGEKGYVSSNLSSPAALTVSCSINVVESDDIPESVLELAKAKRAELLEQLAEVDDEMGELLIMDETPTTAQLVAAIRRATVGLKFSPVFLGSAIKNTAVQPMLDGVCAYLANPAEGTVTAHDTTQPASAPPVPLVPASDAPLVGLAFKLEEGRFGQLTYMRVYQGTLKKGGIIYNARTGKKVKVPRLVRMHSNEMEVCVSAFYPLLDLTSSLNQDIESIGPGEICAIFGVECSSGDTFTDGSTSFSMVSTLMYSCCWSYTDNSEDVDVRSRTCDFSRNQT